MSNTAFDNLVGINCHGDKFWSLLHTDKHFYRLNRAYNTISECLDREHEASTSGTLFDRYELRMEQLQLQHKICDILNHS